MRRADRLFQIVQLLRTQRFTTADSLGRELEISARTVYRDIRDLKASGVPIEGEVGVGYRLARGYELPPLTFQTEEIEALVLGARLVQAYGDPEIARAAHSVLTKVEAVLPTTLREVLLRTALFAFRPSSADEAAREVHVLRRAIADRHKIRFAYRRADGEESERTVRPLGLYFWGPSWSLAAYCELRADFRSFRPDRMVTLRVLEDRFDDSDGIDLGAFIRRMETQLDEAPVP